MSQKGRTLCLDHKIRDNDAHSILLSGVELLPNVVIQRRMKTVDIVAHGRNNWSISTV
jgi:hypothetical protein